MDTLAQIREAVRRTPANPLARTEEDWVPWLVFADWLAEHDDPRGRWIAHQHAVEMRLGTKSQRTAWRKELRQFGDDGIQARRWLDGLELSADVELTWAHGFVVGLTLHGPRGVPFLDALLTHPAGVLLSWVRCHNVYLRPLLSCARLDRLVRIDIVNYGTHPGELAAFAQEEALAAVRHFELRSYGRRIPGAELLGTPLIDGLEHLTCLHVSLATKTLESLVERSDLTRLTTLELKQTALDASGAAVLANATLPALVVLSLRHNGLGPEGGRAIATRMGLASLDLGACSIGNAGLVALTETRSAPTLRRLEVSECAIGRAGGLALAQSEALALEVLDLSGNAIGTAPIVALAAGSLPHTLRRLDLRRTGLGDAAIRALTRRTGWEQLEWLHVGDNPISSTMRGTLTAAPNLGEASVYT